MVVSEKWLNYNFGVEYHPFKLHWTLKPLRHVLKQGASPLQVHSFNLQPQGTDIDSDYENTQFIIKQQCSQSHQLWLKQHHCDKYSTGQTFGHILQNIIMLYYNIISHDV